MKNKTFDYIVYSASLQGIVFAKYAAEAGKSVLLINRYGFPGGDVTYGLNCLQSLVKNKTPFINDFLMNISKSKNALFYSDQQYQVFNPEVLKYELIKSIEQCQFEKLFHVLPTKIICGDDNVKLTVAAREGKQQYTAKIIVDASENGELIKLSDITAVNEYEFLINVFTSQFAGKLLLPDLDIKHEVKLTDSRRWLSIKLNNSGSGLLENKTQELLKRIDTGLLDNGMRLQIVPVQPVAKCNILESAAHKNLISVTSTFGLDGQVTKRLTDISILEDKLSSYEF